MCTLCTMFPSGLLGGSIVFQGFVGKLLRSEPGSAEEEKKRKPTNGSVVGWNCMELSGWNPWKKCTEDESIEGNVQDMESNKGKHQNMV
jgi:hypothetical protein